MALGRRRRERQEDLFVATSEIRSMGSPFYEALNGLLGANRFDEFVEDLYGEFYAETRGRPSVAPGVYFRMLTVGYLEGIDSDRGMAWRCADSISLRGFLAYGFGENPPDHSSLSRTRRRLSLEVHEEVFTWVLWLVRDHGLLRGKTLGVDSTTLEANAAMRSIVRRDGGSGYREYLEKLAKESGIASPTQSDIAKLDRKLPKKGSNDDWVHPGDREARISKMKDGRTRLAHKLEHAVDMDSGAVTALTVQSMKGGDTASLPKTLDEAAKQLGEVELAAQEVVADKGYHSNRTIEDLKKRDLRSYVNEPRRGRRSWKKDRAAQAPTCANRCRIKGKRGRALLRKRGELLERAFAHMLVTGAMRRVHLRGAENIRKRMLVHGGACNLGSLMRTLVSRRHPARPAGARNHADGPGATNRDPHSDGFLPPGTAVLPSARHSPQQPLLFLSGLPRRRRPLLAASSHHRLHHPSQNRFCHGLLATGLRFRCILAVLLVGALAVGAEAQRDNDQRRGLEFSAAEIRYEQAERRLRRVEGLHEAKLVSRAELETEQAELRLAALEMGHAYFALFLADPQVVLQSARKFQGPDGGVRVELEIVARSSPDLASSGADRIWANALQLPVVKGLSNVVVSLKTVLGYRDGLLLEPTIVSVPYEQRLLLLPFDEPVTIDFGLLLADVQELLVEIRYNGDIDRRQVLLGKRANSEEPVIVRSDQVTLDAEFGADAVYDLNLERFDDASAIYGLGVEGLPPEVAFRLTDPASGAVFSQVFFPEGVTDRELRLTLNMPSRPTASVQPDNGIRFSLVLERGSSADGALVSSVVGALELAVVPRGVARLELEAANLYHEVQRGHSLAFEVKVINTGSRTLEQVELSVDTPFGWKTEVQPSLFPSLEPGASEVTVVGLVPPVDVILGDYEGSVSARTLSGDRIVQSEQKTFRLHVLAARNLWLATGFAVAACTVLAMLIWAALRLSRR